LWRWAPPLSLPTEIIQLLRDYDDFYHLHLLLDYIIVDSNHFNLGTVEYYLIAIYNYFYLFSHNHNHNHNPIYQHLSVFKFDHHNKHNAINFNFSNKCNVIYLVHNRDICSICW
jgi:hypothetical protein